MSADELLLRSRRVLLPTGEQAACVRVRDGLIAEILPHDAPDGSLPLHDFGERVLMPGVVDTHVHVNEPGRTEWEGFATASRAAAAGGLTTLVDMPLNSIPVTTSLAALEAKRAAASGQCWVDFGFWGGVVPDNADELEPMIRAGICGFKAFMCHSGIDDFPASGEADLRRAMTILARHRIPLLVHAELEGPLPDAPEADPRRYETFLASRPAAWEEAAIAQLVALCRETGCAVHVVHLSAASALPLIAAARAEGLPFSAETCPHYLTLAAEDVPDGATEFKCAPPIRERANREALWAGLQGGVLDFVACDHSPCTAGLKLPETGDFMGAWGGIASVQFSLSLVWSEARARGCGPEALLPWLCGRTAALAGFAGQKGAIAPGCDADFVVWDPEATFTVTPERIHYKNRLSPYFGRTLHGVVHATYARGRRVFDGEALAGTPGGRLLSRSASAEAVPS